MAAAQQPATLELQAILAEVTAASDVASDVEKPIGQSTSEDNFDPEEQELNDSDEEFPEAHRCVPKELLQATEDDITDEFRALEGKSKDFPFIAKPSSNSEPKAKTVMECQTKRIIVLSKKNLTGLQSETSDEEDELDKLAETHIKEKTG